MVKLKCMTKYAYQISFIGKYLRERKKEAKCVQRPLEGGTRDFGLCN